MCYWKYEYPIKIHELAENKPLYAYKKLKVNWGYDDGNGSMGLLKSSQRSGNIWWDGKMNAGGQMPKDGSGRGIYCLKNRKDLKDEIGQVVVKVAIYGKVYEYEGRFTAPGYKAQYAKIVEVSVPPFEQYWLTDIRRANPKVIVNGRKFGQKNKPKVKVAA